MGRGREKKKRERYARGIGGSRKEGGVWKDGVFARHRSNPHSSHFRGRLSLYFLSLPKSIHVQYSTPYQKRRSSSLGDFHYYHRVRRRCSCVARNEMITRRIKVSEAPRLTGMRVRSLVRTECLRAAWKVARAAFVSLSACVFAMSGRDTRYRYIAPYVVGKKRRKDGGNV